MARDDFKKPVVQLLKSRVASRCSNPDCRVSTSGPSNKDKVNNIGIAAHITAASEGGPRYDPSLTFEQRVAFENGIWLCSNCAGKIDRDATLYTVQLLKDWKFSAEQKALEELGVKIPDQRFIDNSIRSAFTGIPMAFHPQAISNIHKASVGSLLALDPRFTIESSYINGLTTYSFEAKENVPLSMHIDTKEQGQFELAFQRFMEEGKDFSIKTDSVSIKGSELLETLFNEYGGEFSLISPKISVLQKVWLVNPENREVDFFYDINGEISAGTKALTFDGSACNGMLRFQSQIFDPDLKIPAKFSISIDHDKWNNLEINQLPYFDKVYAFFTKLDRGWEFFTSLERNGEVIVNSIGQDLRNHEFVYLTRNFLDYTSYCRTISSKLKVEVKYSTSVVFTKEDIKKLNEVAETFLGRRGYSKASDLKGLSCRLVVEKDLSNVNFLKNMTEPTVLRAIQEEPDKVMLFETPVTLPLWEILVNSVIPKHSSDFENVKAGDIINIEWTPHENFSFACKYILNQ